MPDVYLLGNATPTQMLSLVIKDGDKTIVFDGGMVGDCLQLTNFLSENCNGKVNAWFFTHPHQDHIGAFCEMNRKNLSVDVEKIYHCFPSVSDQKKFEYRDKNEVSILNDTKFFFKTKYKNRVFKLKKDDKFDFNGVTVKVLRVFNKKITANFVNNSSTVFRVETQNGSILILGDLGIEGGDELMHIRSLSDLKTDYTQMAHHGQSGVRKEFYEYIKPKRCIWGTPDWLWNNDNGGGFDSGPWQTVRTREWMKELDVKEHFLSKDGTQKII